MIIIYSIFSILCICTGFYFGYYIGNKDKVPEINPIKITEKVTTELQDYKKQKEKEKAVNTLNDIVGNISNYDGTSNNQKKIKRG